MRNSELRSCNLIRSVLKGIKLLPGFRRLDRYLRRRYTGSERPEFALRGSYYSPLPDYQDVEARSEELFASEIDLDHSIRLRADQQEALLREISRFYPEFDWPERSCAARRFHLNNGYFGAGDAIALYALLRHFFPERIIEVGSGFTSALMLDTNDQFLDGSVRFTFVEPYPQRLRSLLTSKDAERAEILETGAQKVPWQVFASLKRNDILFIDSSHVAKIGSDVNYLFFEILPRLQSGVVVHFHDIIWPFEYPKEWIMEGRAWNEVYMVRAFLQYNEAFEIVLFNSYIGHCLRGLLAELMPKFLEDTGGSLWLQKR